MARQVLAVGPEIESVWRAALLDVRARRGGSRYLQDILGDHVPETVLEHFAQVGVLWTDDVSSILIVRDRVIVVLFVPPAHRRQGRGRALVQFARDDAPAAHDALALPGDRATKSLYESVGWKARLLTLGAA